MSRHRWNVLSILTAAVFVSAALTFACADDEDTSPTGPSEPNGQEEDDHGPGEEELITTLKITLTPSGGGAPLTVQFQDLDGEGGNAPVVDRIVVDAGTVYSGSVQVLNETESPPENITEDVKGEDRSQRWSGGGTREVKVSANG